MARSLIVIGILIVIIGILLLQFPRAFSWFGNLPGDIDVRRGNSRLFIPLTSMLAASVGLTVVLNVIGWIVRQWR